MHAFAVNSIESAPEKSKSAVRTLQSTFGFIPNVAGGMSTSPVLVNSLVALFGNVHGGSFSEPQIQTLLLTNAVTNGATWAVAFHSFLALKEGIDESDVDAIRSGRPPADDKLAALSVLAKTLIEKRGRLENQDKEKFFAAGFGPDRLLEVIAVVAASTITNYTANITQPPARAGVQTARLERP
jgi:alkylhydroperoxidase family enzyme